MIKKHLIKSVNILASALTFILYSPTTHAQLKWTPSAQHNDSLPRSVRVYQTTDSLEGKPFRAFYLIADLADKNISVETRTGDGKRYTPSEYLQKETGKVYAVANACFFSYADNSNVNMVVSGGKLKSFNRATDTVKSSAGKRMVIYPTQGVFGILKNGLPDVAWVYNVGKKKTPFEYASPNATDNEIASPPKKGRKWNVQEAAGGGPVLLPYISSVQENRFAWHELDKHPRTAIGYTADNKVIILAVEGRHPGIAAGANLLQLAAILKSLGCVEALNLDGGGSSCLLASGQHTITPSDKTERPVPSVFIIKARMPDK